MISLLICLISFLVAALFFVASFLIKNEKLNASIFIPSAIMAILCIGIAVATAVGIVVRMTERFSYNSWYSTSTSDLIGTVVDKLENGEVELVIEELKTLETEIHPTYEVRGNYDELVVETIKRLDATEKRDSGAVEKAQ